MSRWEPQLGATDDWFTPRYIFEALGETFDLDVAAPPEGPRHVPCIRWLSARSLESPWFGFVWMNPPYGARNSLAPWLDKFTEHGDGVALVVDRTSAPWFQKAARDVDAILFISPKVRFERPDGSWGNSPGNGSALFGIGSRAQAAMRRGRNLGLLVSPWSD